ncbi:MAG: Re/Si-specific NAD(P)(+) transhydrogenase subunit alpha, partial [Planctomycetales bacterium]|nr:Re/Si-specific NAD(P)(+) transhydrogenase subunit alpha [Planctomycetales bacterium]
GPRANSRGPMGTRLNEEVIWGQFLNRRRAPQDQEFMKIAIVRETFPGERRVALVPANVPALLKLGAEVLVQTGAGDAAGYLDSQYVEKGAKLVASRDEAFTADIVLQVRAAGANATEADADLARLRRDQIVIGTCDPLGSPAAIGKMASSGATLFALELIPRITRAQSMDVLSSMATIAGYRAVLLAAVELPRMFPMFMTAAGTISAARVFIIGAGVAGLQAIATARRLGAIVHAYDVRPACREQCESLGAKFVELALESSGAEDKGGYAKAQDEEFYRRQRELMANVVRDSDVVVTTAAIPGKKSPLLITADAVRGMSPGSVIVDLAAERGGNCELSQPDQRVEEQGVLILGPTNLPSEIPYHASQMFSNNVTRFLQNLIKDGAVRLNREDQIIGETLAAHGGEVVEPRLRQMLGLGPSSVAEEPSSSESVPPAQA